MKNLFLSLLLWIFIGCGGGNSSDRKTVNFTGYEIDGLTQVNNGDKVSFYVGDIFLAKVSNAHENMTPFDLAEVTAPIKALDVKRSLKEKSLNKVMNIASFLQTIDQDGDAKNGIEIPKALEVLTKDVYLDFNASPHTFSHSFALRKLMAEGRKHGVWEADRHIVNPYVALDTLYVSLNLKPEIFVVKSENHRIGDEDKHSTNQFDTLGRLVSSQYKGNDPRRANGKKLFFYDKYFNQIREEIYLDSNVVIQFDEYGNVFYTNRASNGKFTLHQIKEKQYNFNADLLRSRLKDVKNGIFTDRNITISYDEYGNLITYERSEYPPFTLNDVNPKLCGSVTYNSLGLKTLEKFDNNCDGSDNQLTQYIYDKNNKDFVTLYDSNADGVIDANISVVFYDGKKEETFVSYYDGVIDSKRIDIYDSHDNVIYRHYEYDGRVYVEDNITYSYSSRGKILKQEVHNKEGVLSETSFTRYDYLDNILVTERKDILNDTLLYKAMYTYDSNGYKLTSDVNYCNGNEYTEVFSYDTFGNELTYKKITKQDAETIKIETNREYINTSKWISLSYRIRREIAN